MKKIIVVLVVFVSCLAFSQKQELGKVSIEELKEKVCPTDTSAVAAVLFNIGKSSIEYSEASGFETITEIITKIKIYKKEGYAFANKSMGYYTPNNGSSERIDVTKAVTYNLVNDKIEKTKLSSNGEFDEKVDKYSSRKKITMPNVKEGSIIEFRFEIRSPYVYIPDWEFQNKIPVLYSEFSTCIPEYYIFNTRFKGFLSPQTLTETNQRTISSTNKERSNGYSTSTTFSTNSTSYVETKNKYILENIPALKDEIFVNNIDNYRVTILHELSGKRFPQRPFENFATDWESIVKKIYDNESFGSELDKTGYFEKDIDAILKGITAQEERIGAVLSYVKTKMNWDEYYGIYCDNGVKKAYQESKGNVAEINLMLTAMLRYAGFEASPILVSTRDNGISLFPSRTAYNYVIAGIELQNQVILLDATSKYSLPNILPIRDLNWFGRIVRKNGSSAEIDLMPKSNSKDITMIMASINVQGEIQGKIREQYFDYNAFLFREHYNSVAKDSYVEKLEKVHQGLEVEEYEVQNKTDLAKPIVENYSFKATNSVEIIGDKMYVSPFLFFTMTENPFKQETREYPIDFIYPDQDRFNISLTLPEGYVVETLPQPKAIALPDNIGSFKYSITNNGNQIQLVYSSDMNEAIIKAEDYEILKSYYKEMVNKQTEKIVLKKV
ncbi:transglutaminase domain-containing protein [Flavobacterium sp. XGLA_31]|uniref:transglutaminase domain-containing protein n=1 Tax=Flavobacterium sp. XGLA_31 TaxID=3447666 RepID=UPI003F316D72